MFLREKEILNETDSADSANVLHLRVGGAVLQRLLFDASARGGRENRGERGSVSDENRRLLQLEVRGNEASASNRRSSGYLRTVAGAFASSDSGLSGLGDVCVPLLRRLQQREVLETQTGQRGDLPATESDSTGHRAPRLDVQ